MCPKASLHVHISEKITTVSVEDWKCRLIIPITKSAMCHCLGHKRGTSRRFWLGCLSSTQFLNNRTFTFLNSLNGFVISRIFLVLFHQIHFNAIIFSLRKFGGRYFHTFFYINTIKQLDTKLPNMTPNYKTFQILIHSTLPHSASSTNEKQPLPAVCFSPLWFSIMFSIHSMVQSFKDKIPEIKWQK